MASWAKLFEVIDIQYTTISESSDYNIKQMNCKNIANEQFYISEMKFDETEYRMILRWFRINESFTKQHRCSLLHMPFIKRKGNQYGQNLIKY